MNKNQLYIPLALIVGIAILINILGEKYSFRIDMTESRAYTLSNATKNILRNLEKPITITAYFSEDLPPDIARTRRDFKDLLVEYHRISGGMVVYNFVNPNKSAKSENEAITDGVEPVIINVREKDQIKQQRAFLGASIVMGENKESIPFMQPGAAMEYVLSSSIKKLSITEKPYIGLVVGHGQPTADEFIQVSQALSVMYNFRAYNMYVEPTEIPTSFKALAIVRPTDSIPDEHFKRLDNYLNNGGRIFISINRVDGDLENGYGYAINTGLEKWLKNKGVEIDEYFITDNICGSISVQQHQGVFRYNSTIPFPFLPLSQKFEKHPVTAGMESAYFTFASPLKFIGDTLKYIFTPVVFSSELSGMLRAPQVFNIRKEWTKADYPYSNLIIAAAIEKRIDHNISQPYMVIVGDGDFAVNGPRHNSQALLPDNVNLMVNAIDWLSDESGLADLRTKGVSSRPLNIIEESTKTFLKYLNFLLPIFLVILFGIYRFYRMKLIRKKRMEERYE